MSVLYITRGDTRTYDIAATDPDGDPWDLTGVELTWTAKRGFDDPDVYALISKEIGDGITVVSAENGTATLVIDPLDTAPLRAPSVLVWDLQARDSEGAVATLAIGTLRVEPDVTRAAEAS